MESFQLGRAFCVHCLRDNTEKKSILSKAWPSGRRERKWFTDNHSERQSHDQEPGYTSIPLSHACVCLHVYTHMHTCAQTCRGTFPTPKWRVSKGGCRQLWISKKKLHMLPHPPQQAKGGEEIRNNQTDVQNLRRDRSRSIPQGRARGRIPGRSNMAQTRQKPSTVSLMVQHRMCTARWLLVLTNHIEGARTGGLEGNKEGSQA